ncbi:MAG TPA: YggS family pyridoxal phosphate-dependent enzyme [Acidimicrobiales bacterium]
MIATDVARRLADVNERIASSGATPGSVTVVAVTKGHGAWAVKAALDAGLADVGENYSAELLEKRAVLGEAGASVRWHFLGHVQRNKVRVLAPSVHLWQGLDRRAAGQEIARRAPGARVLVQVNVSGDEARNGCRFDEAPALATELGALGLDVRGVMAVGPVGAAEARRAYRRLNTLADRLGLVERSMGMSSDFVTAVEEGSTMVRIGEALFGAREARTSDADLRR